jgi:hypothetical protein
MIADEQHRRAASLVDRFDGGRIAGSDERHGAHYIDCRPHGKQEGEH